MRTIEKSKFNDELRERTMSMAQCVHDIFLNRHIPILDRSTVNQIIRCSSSVAANFRAASRARSDAEFYAKICIVVEECDETLFWLEYLVRTKVIKPEEITDIWEKGDQLVRLFNKIRYTMKEKLQGKKMPM